MYGVCTVCDLTGPEGLCLGPEVGTLEQWSVGTIWNKKIGLDIFSHGREMCLQLCTVRTEHRLQPPCWSHLRVGIFLHQSLKQRTPDVSSVIGLTPSTGVYRDVEMTRDSCSEGLGP